MRFVRVCFFVLVVKPLLLVILGMNVRRREALPGEGPAVVVANHNSHLDVLALMSLFPLGALHRVRAVAAADYFLRNRFLAWFALEIIGIIPINREVDGFHEDPLAGVCEALDRGEIVILFPEGSRGVPERMSGFRKGVAHLARRRPGVPFFPVFLHGLGKALPRGEAILVPFFCDVFVGEAMGWGDDRAAFMEGLEQRMAGLAAEGRFPEWE
ncbi:MAG: hypothetical protein RI897_2946 [Verrucomicrobiota bacterium]